SRDARRPRRLLALLPHRSHLRVRPGLIDRESSQPAGTACNERPSITLARGIPERLTVFFSRFEPGNFYFSRPARGHPAERDNPRRRARPTHRAPHDVASTPIEGTSHTT